LRVCRQGHLQPRSILFGRVHGVNKSASCSALKHAAGPFVLSPSASIAFGPQSVHTRPVSSETAPFGDLACARIARVSPGFFEASTAALEGGLRVVAVRGELDLGTAPELEGPLDEAIGAQQPLLIDLSECEF